MIEMLGVLALVGVLSVGGIAGYSKAMEMYKTNKQAEQLDNILRVLIYNSEKFNENKQIYSSTIYPVVPVLKAMGEIPEEMIIHTDAEVNPILGELGLGISVDKDNLIRDSFGQQYAIAHQSTEYSGEYINIATVLDGENVRNCKNMFQLGKKFSKDINYILIYGYGNGIIYGDGLCEVAESDRAVCLKNLAPHDISSICSQLCINDTYNFCAFTFTLLPH